MNVDRRLADGSRHKEESVNKSQVYVTTAGWKNTFAYDKLLMLLIQSVVYPEEAVVMGGTWRVPVLEGLLSRSFVDELKLDGTYNEASFQREYESVWGGDAENAFFSSERIDRQRILNLPEYEYTKSRTGINSYYIIAVDVGRKGCASEALIWKISPQPQGSSLKSLVNIITFDDEHFEDQCIGLKKLYYRYKARRLVLDANGLGIGLVDYMVKSQIDPDTGDVIPDFGVYNDEENFYKKYRTSTTEQDALYLVKANAPINTEAFTYVQTQLSSGKVKLLIDEAKAKQKLMSTKVGQNMTMDQRAEYLRPFTQTSILRDQMLNLVEENEGINIILKQKTKSIKKDKFSAMCYGLYYVKQEEDKNKKKKRLNIKDFMFFK